MGHVRRIGRIRVSVIGAVIMSSQACRDNEPVSPDNGRATTPARRFATSSSVASSTKRYAKPGGSMAGSGDTQANAWDLQFAFNGAGGVLMPGDTVWLLDGPYHAVAPGRFTVTVSGLFGQPIVFRQYPGARANLDRNIDGTGGTLESGSNPVALEVNGSYTEFWDFEITNSSTATRSTPTSTNHEWLPNMIWNRASHVKFVNLVIHDGGQAIFNDVTASDVIISGCIIYNNGWERPNAQDPLSKTDGHGLYLKNNNTAESVTASDNIVFNQFGYGIHAYTNAFEEGIFKYLRNIKLRWNVSFNNGTSSQFQTSANLGNLGEPASESMAIDSNMLYFSPNLSPGPGVNLDYGNTTGPSQRLPNRVVGGGTPAIIEGTGWPSRNDVIQQTPVGEWSKVHPHSPLADPYRATVVVFSQTAQQTVNPDFSGFLSQGDNFVVRNVQDMSVRAQGIYSGSVEVDNSGVNAPAPYGQIPGRTTPITGPTFNVFVATRVPASPPAIPAPGLSLSCVPVQGGRNFRVRATVTQNAAGTTLTLKDSLAAGSPWQVVQVWPNAAAGVYNTGPTVPHGLFRAASSVGADSSWSVKLYKSC